MSGGVSLSQSETNELVLDDIKANDSNENAMKTQEKDINSLSNDKLDNYIKRLKSNFQKEFSNKMLNKILKIVLYTKNEINNSNSDNILPQNSNSLSKSTMISNLEWLIPERHLLDNAYPMSGNKVDEFCGLLDTYANSHNFKIKDLKLTKSDMINTLVWLLKNENCQNRNELFIKALNIYSTNDEFDINYQTNPQIFNDSYLFTLLHWCIYKNNLVILRYLLSNFKDKLDFSVKDQRNRTPYEYSIEGGDYNMGSLILEASLGLNLSNAITTFCDNNDEINSISQLFLLYLQQNCGNDKKLDEIINLLEKTLINLVENKKCFSKFMLKIVFDYNIIKNNKLNVSKYNTNNLVLNVKTNKLWKIIQNKLKLVLNINTLYKEKVDWFWFKNYVLNTNIWLYKIGNNKILYNELLNIVKNELSKQKNRLKQDMKSLINKNKTIWNKICNFEFISDKYESHRQDIISNGIKCLYNKNELNDINITNNNNSLQIFSINDFNNYLSNLIILGHKLNKYFIVSIESIFDNYIKDKKCNFKCGPVKTLERCIIKSQLDYNNCKYPTSAHIIDIIRGSLTFNHLEDYYNGIQVLIKAINSKNSKHYISDILRIKHGFNKSYKKYLKIKNENDEKTNVDNENDTFIPIKYLDVKINLVITYNKQSIIGELQLLLQPMLNNKKQNHELYEITRLNDIILHSNNKLKNNNPTKQLEISITDRNKHKIAKLITCNNINSINVNKTGNNSTKTPLFLACIKRNSLHDLMFKYFKHTINYTISDNSNANILHYIGSYLKEENEVNKQVLDPIFDAIFPKHGLLINEKLNSGYNFTPIMNCLYNQNQFVFSNLMAKLLSFPNTSFIDFSIIDRHKNNIFHNFFMYYNFNNNLNNLDILMKRYQIYKNTKNLNMNDYNLLFSFGQFNKTIFHFAFESNKSFSLEILKKLEVYLNENGLFYFIFEFQDEENKYIPLMHLIEQNNVSIIDYLLNKYKKKVIRFNYQMFTQIKNLNYQTPNTVIELVKELDKNNKIVALFKSYFPKLFE